MINNNAFLSTRLRDCLSVIWMIQAFQRIGCKQRTISDNSCSVKRKRMMAYIYFSHFRISPKALALLASHRLFYLSQLRFKSLMALWWGARACFLKKTAVAGPGSMEVSALRASASSSEQITSCAGQSLKCRACERKHGQLACLDKLGDQALWVLASLWRSWFVLLFPSTNVWVLNFHRRIASR